jgi:hypothetical protein
MMSSLTSRAILKSFLKLLATLPILVSGIATAQTDSPLQGIVSDQSGKVITGVSVLGGKTKDCCPVLYDHAITNERGEFHLEHPGAVIRFFPADLEPLTIVLSPGTSQLRVTLPPLGKDLSAPRCGPKKSGIKRIGGRVAFDVPSREVHILGGKTDVDYVGYTIKPKTGNSYLQFWFGPYAISEDPHDEDFLDSVSFSQKRIVEAEIGIAGIDSRGRKRNGETWRQAVVAGEGGARYTAYTDKDVDLFDRIVDSICVVPASR